MRKTYVLSETRFTDFYNQSADNFKKWRKKNSYFYKEISDFHKHLIGADKKVLEVGAATGELLADLAQDRNQCFAIDQNLNMISSIQAFFPNIQTEKARCEDIEAMARAGQKNQFDYIIANGLLSASYDVQATLKGLHALCRPKSRVIVTTYNTFWEPILEAGAKLGLRSKSPLQNWLSDTDLENLFSLEDFEVVSRYQRVLIPKYIPLVSWIANKILIHVPVIRSMSLMNYHVLRKMGVRAQGLSVTIVIPARNEAGNIENAIKRLPNFGSHQQIIFVEGNSTDNTWSEMERLRLKYHDKDILTLRQPGKGKGDAVRFGFEHATGEVLLILDADLTVPPEDLPKFYEALINGKGEFINGTRLVYPMQKEAMRFLNLLGNKFFAWAFSWLLSQRLRDTLCGTKVLLRSDYERIAANRNYFGDFDPFGDFDLLFGAARQNLKIVEVPVRYRERTYGKTNISRFKHGWLLLKMCIYAAKKIKFC